MKFCSKCNIEKDDFLFRKNRNQCKECLKEDNNRRNKKYRVNNKEKLAKKAKENYVYNKQYYEDNKKDILENKKKFYEDNKESILSIQKLYWHQHKEMLQNYHKAYYVEHKDEIKERKRLYENVRRKTDYNFKLKQLVSGAIYKFLKRKGFSKGGNSCIKYLPYTIQELRDHLEKQFEPWMSWENHGLYDAKTYNINPTWQIDHIIPQSRLPYTSMKDDNFNKCWALENLRPLSSKQNFLDRDRK